MVPSEVFDGGRYQQLINVELLGRVSLLPENSRIVILLAGGWKPSVLKVNCLLIMFIGANFRIKAFYEPFQKGYFFFETSGENQRIYRTHLYMRLSYLFSSFSHMHSIAV